MRAQLTSMDSHPIESLKTEIKKKKTRKDYDHI